MKRKILFVLALIISIVTHSQITIQPADLKGAEKSVTITFTTKGDIIQASATNSYDETDFSFLCRLKFQGTTGSQLFDRDVTDADYIPLQIVNSSTGVSTTLKAAGKDKFTIPKDLPAGSYNFKLNGKLIATNYKVK